MRTTLAVSVGLLALGLSTGCKPSAPKTPPPDAPAPSPTAPSPAAPAAPAAPHAPAATPKAAEAPSAKAPSPVHTADGRCADLACLAEAVRTCRPMQTTIEGTTSMLGMNVKGSVDWTIAPADGADCALTSKTRSAAVTFDARVVALLRERGANTTEVERKRVEVEKRALDGDMDVHCVATGERLAELLTKQAQGKYDSADWEVCQKPTGPTAAGAPCYGAKPQAMKGCAVLDCQGGEWPIRCGATTCRIAGAVGAKSFVGCTADGKLNISTKP